MEEEEEEKVVHEQRKQKQDRACLCIYSVRGEGLPTQGEGVGGGHLIDAELHPFLRFWLVPPMKHLPRLLSGRSDQIGGVCPAVKL